MTWAVLNSRPISGYPQAHEDDAERAVRAGLAIIEAVSNGPSPDRLAVRIGIHTGLTVIGDAGGKADVFGETPNVAARVQGAAAPDTVVVSAATQRLVAGLFVVEDRGAQPLKGIEQPVQLYRVIRAGVGRRRTGGASAPRTRAAISNASLACR